MVNSGYEVRTATAGEHDQFVGLFGAAMMFESAPSDLDRELFEPGRALVAVDGGQFVGTAKAMSRDLAVPGGVVPAAHVTAVGVRATHRRRGILSELMSRQLREVPEALAVLWASEPGIYGRFGYAPAAWGVSYEADLRTLKPYPVPSDAGSLEELAADDAVAQLAPMLRELQAKRPGVSGRSEQEWRRRLQDKPDDRGGRTARQILVHRNEAGALDGYALWRGKLSWGPGGPANEVSVEEFVALEPTAYHALWHHLLTLDLAGKLEYGHAALDELLQQLVTNPVALNRRLTESLWVRITDVGRALAQRRYATGVDVVIEVTDDLITANNGRYRLTGDLEQATCEPSDSAPDLSLSVRELAAAYLGGRPLSEFTATGRVTEHTAGALSALTAALRWPVAPVSIEIF
ncbi:acetyltransferase [Kribbella flavida DSM 17836]|uniref:Acetyltransferase n=1 Tax=Kribbella flavida (strain DSM 17836 / JCM 10339 / NBRC 14399) TaxID=479435 RepID=D2PKZ2_KRIFD|nr:GNAT family N-acetyltransferase [Kribbella flavida]ADB32459.1 acetyltransferase [Kribbella flavida DSM 17836]